MPSDAVDGVVLTDEEQREADELAKRFADHPQISHQIRVATMAHLSQLGAVDPANADAYNAAFEELRQEGIDAERSAHRALGIRGRVRAWYRAHRDRYARDPLQRLSRLVRRALASLSGLRLR